jgi:translation initiation factor 1 (eIF-1/SUI1)
MRTPEYPDVNEKILTWIENANLFQEALEKVMNDLKKESIE